MARIKRKKMRVLKDISLYLGLFIISVLMLAPLLLVWSNGKAPSMTGTVNQVDISSRHGMAGYDPQEKFQADIFRPPKMLPEQPQRPLQREIPKPLPAETSKNKSQAIVDRNPHVTRTEVSQGSASKNEKLQNASSESAPLFQKKPRSPWWKQHTLKACKDLNMAESQDYFTPDMLENIIVDDTNKLLFCLVPKVASTTWRRVFLELTGKVDAHLTISADDIHHKYQEQLTYLMEFSDPEISLRLRNYFKFMFVRDPLERVLSAYKNKFLAKSESADYFRKYFGRDIIAKYRKPSLIPKINTGHNVTFEEFVNYLVDDKKGLLMNEHWDLFYKLCHPCLVEYDFIGHLERIGEDSQYILDSNSLSGRVKVPVGKNAKYGQRQTDTYMKEYYSKLPPPTISRLYQMYKADYLIFNYTIPADVSSLIKT